MGFGGFKCATMKLPVPSPKGPVLFYEPPLPHWQLIDSQFSITPPTLNTLLAMTDLPSVPPKNHVIPPQNNYHPPPPPPPGVAVNN